MPPTLKRILWNGLPAAVLLAGLGFALAETAGFFLDANRPARQLSAADGAAPLADPVPADLRRSLPVSMAVWGFALVAGYEGVRRLLKGPGKKAGPRLPPVPAGAAVDKLLSDLMRKAEADRAGPDTTTPPPVGLTPQHVRPSV